MSMPTTRGLIGHLCAVALISPPYVSRSQRLLRRGTCLALTPRPLEIQRLRGLAASAIPRADSQFPPRRSCPQIKGQLLALGEVLFESFHDDGGVRPHLTLHLYEELGARM